MSNRYSAGACDGFASLASFITTPTPSLASIWSYIGLLYPVGYDVVRTDRTCCRLPSLTRRHCCCHHGTTTLDVSVAITIYAKRTLIHSTYFITVPSILALSATPNPNLCRTNTHTSTNTYSTTFRRPTSISASPSVTPRTTTASLPPVPK